MAISDSNLKKKLQATLEPFYQAHMSDPSQTSLEVTVDPDQIYWSLTIGSVDFDGLDSLTKSSFTRTFNTLAQTLDPDPNREATGLDYVEAE